MSTSAEQPLPTFLIIGAMKAGTTTLWSWLREHPQVHMGSIKEPQFFATRSVYDLGIDWYRSLFADAPPGALAFGEASTNYTKWPRCAGTPQRMLEAVPDVRLIYLVREPLSRIRSQHVHNAAVYDERRPLRTAVEEEPAYLDICRYRSQLDQYLPHIDRSQLLVLTSDDLRAAPEATLRRVHEFIGVDPDLAPDELPPNANTADVKLVDRRVVGRLRHTERYKRIRRRASPQVQQLMQRSTRTTADKRVDLEISDDLGRRIIDELRDDIAGLREFLGDDFDGWGHLRAGD